MTTQYGYICIKKVEAWTVGVQKMRCPTLSCRVKEDVHCSNILKIPVLTLIWGKKMFSNIFYVIVSACLCKSLNSTFSCSNQELLIDGQLKIATGSHMCQLCV